MLHGSLNNSTFRYKQWLTQSLSFRVAQFSLWSCFLLNCIFIYKLIYLYIYIFFINLIFRPSFQHNEGVWIEEVRLF